MNVDYLEKNIKEALSKIDSHKVQVSENDFGQGNSNELFLQSIKKDDIWQLNHQKQFRDI